MDDGGPRSRRRSEVRGPGLTHDSFSRKDVLRPALKTSTYKQVSFARILRTRDVNEQTKGQPWHTSVSSSSPGCEPPPLHALKRAHCKPCRSVRADLDGCQECLLRCVAANIQESEQSRPEGLLFLGTHLGAIDGAVLLQAGLARARQTSTHCSASASVHLVHRTLHAGQVCSLHSGGCFSK